MNNTDKLLRAFIEASGFEIEEVIERTELTKEQGDDFIERELFGEYILEATEAEYIRGRKDSYFKVLRDPIIDYKVSKREFKPCGDSRTWLYNTQGVAGGAGAKKEKD